MKRAFDLGVAGLALIVLAPVLGVTAALVASKLGRPVLFRQVRAGYRGRLFCLVKFRSMTPSSDETGRALPDEHRLTPFGRWLRATSLDELPELWNVLRGEMSLVGPRPLLVEYLGRYTPEQARRHDVRPGLTGWAQIHGRNDQSWDERLRLDVWYVDHRSLWLDLRILLRTVGLVVSGRGVSAPGSATMPEFRGLEASAVRPAADASSKRAT